MKVMNQCSMVSFGVFFVMGALAVEVLSGGMDGTLPKLKEADRPQWENLDGLDLVPCPKQVEVLPESFPVDGTVAIVIGQAASDRTKIAAQDFQKIVEEMTSVKIPILEEGQAVKQDHLILMGTVGEFSRLQADCKTAGVSLAEAEAQGYAIFPISNDGKQGLALVGKDEQGVYWGAMTLSSLLRDGALQMVRILDWPDFKGRVCETLMRPAQQMFRAKTDEQKKAAWAAVEAGVREAARLKFNYIRCFAVLYSDPKTDYILDDRARILGEIGKYANQRGIKLNLNFSGVVGAEGDEEEFPQLLDGCKFLHLYASWSDEELIARACDRLGRMVKIIGPQLYQMHSPDVPGMGWSRRSDSDRERWGDDRTAAEGYLMDRLFGAMKEAAPGVECSYVSTPYFIGKADESLEYTRMLKIVKELTQKIDPEIRMLWREGSVESTRRFRELTGSHPQVYYIENSSFHDNRLVGATARVAKSFYFENNDRDIFVDNSNTSSQPMHKPQNGILAEYSWNIQAPGSVLIHQSADPELTHNSTDGMTVEGLDWQEWSRTKDLADPAIQDELLPRVCRKFFGAQVGDVMALAYGAGSTSNDRAQGGFPSLSYSQRYTNSLNVATQLGEAVQQMDVLWDKKELFNAGTYSVYQTVFKHVYVYCYVSQVNAALMELSWIAKIGENKEELPRVIEEAFAAVEQAKTELTEGYRKYNFESVRYSAIYGAEIGDLKNVIRKIETLAEAIRFKLKEIEMLGAGNVEPEKGNTVLGLAPLTADFKLDGEIDEWNLSKRKILDSRYQRGITPGIVPEPTSSFAYWDTAWDSSGLYLSALIFDDELSFTTDSQIYKNDSLEFWVNKEQFIVSFSPSGKTLIESYGNYDQANLGLAVKRGAGDHPLHPDMNYWTVEVHVPMECVLNGVGERNSFYFALGINDVDSGSKDQSLYFPHSYAHLGMVDGASCSKNFARAVMQKKAVLSANLFSSSIKNVTKQDGTYTCVDLKMMLDSKEMIYGVTAEIRLYEKAGIHRFPVEVPPILNGKWMGTSLPQTDTGKLHESDIGMDLIIRAPGFYKRFMLQDGAYRDAPLRYIGELM